MLFQFDNVRYQFNVPEGTSRSYSQRRMGQMGSNNNSGAIFLPATCSEAMGGLHGFLMGIADSAKAGSRTSVSVVGAPHFKTALAAGRLFNKRDTLAIDAVEAKADQESKGVAQVVFKDDRVTVSAVLLERQPSSLVSSAAGSAAPTDSSNSTPETDAEHRQKRVRLSDTLSPSAPKFDPSVDPKPWLAANSGDGGPSWEAQKLKGKDAERYIDATIADMYKYKKDGKPFEPADDPLLNGGGGGEQGEEGTEKGPSRGGMAHRYTKLPLPNQPQWLRDERRNRPESARERRERALPSSTLAYILETPRMRGTIDAKAASDLGLASGPIIGQIAAGNTVTIQRPVAWNEWDQKRREDWLRMQRPPRVKKIKQQGPEKQGKKGKQQQQHAQKEVAATVVGTSANEAQAPAPSEPLESVEIRPDMIMKSGQQGSVSDRWLSIHIHPHWLTFHTHQAFIQIYMPSITFLDSLLFSREFDRFCDTSEDSDVRASFVLHCVADEVLETARYQEWMRLFPAETDHFITSPSFTDDRLAYPSASLSSLRLGYIDDKIFGLPPWGRSAPKVLPPTLPEHTRTLPDEYTTNFLPHRPHSWHLFEHHVRNWATFPTSPSDSAALSKLASLLIDPADGSATEAVAGEELTGRQKLQLARSEAWPKYLHLAQTLREQVAAEELKRTEQVAEAAARGLDKIFITTLGTGSASPSKYRNVSATLVEAPELGTILLDAGESTYGQLCRKFGDRIDQILRDLRIIFISHIHADHHLGLARLLNARAKLDPPPEQPLYLISNFLNRIALEEYAMIEFLELHGSVKLVDSGAINYQGVESRTNQRTLQWSLEHAQHLKETTGLTEISTIPVKHRAMHCYGIVLRHASGWSISYSGDTVPCKAMSEASKGVSVMIHEATIEDDQPAMAAAKGHSTFGQAVDVARTAGAENCLLTHFSQRYPKVARLGEDAGQGSSKTTVALSFDLMRVSIAELWKVERYRPAIEMLYEADEEAAAEKEREKEKRASTVADAEVEGQSVSPAAEGIGHMSIDANPAPAKGNKDKQDKKASKEAPNKKSNVPRVKPTMAYLCLRL